MSGQFIEDIVNKLVLLEQKTGAQVHYRVMSPFHAQFHDHLSIQGVAKRIAEFIGLDNLTFVIAIAKQKDNVAGHIDLSTEGNEVFVEVDSEMMEFPNAVAATLCHEACHEWLKVNGLCSSAESDNEILTDITTIFLGFGKIMLNGCRTTDVKHESIPNGTRTITKTMSAGYLDRDQLAFAYRLVCAMRSIPSSDFTQGLSEEAIRAVEKSDSLYGHYYYSTALHRTEARKNAIGGFDNWIVAAQGTMSELDKHVTYVKKSFCETIDDFLSAGHKRLDSVRNKIVAMTQCDDLDPALRFLHAIQNDFEAKRLNGEVQTMVHRAEGLLDDARDLGSLLSRNSQNFPMPSPNMFSIVTCPHDGTKLRLPENSGDLIATCPKCKYRFVYNTNTLSFPVPPASRKPAWWNKVRSLLKLKRNS